MDISNRLKSPKNHVVWSSSRRINNFELRSGSVKMKFLCFKNKVVILKLMFWRKV